MSETAILAALGWGSAALLLVYALCWRHAARRARERARGLARAATLFFDGYEALDEDDRARVRGRIAEG